MNFVYIIITFLRFKVIYIDLNEILINKNLHI